MSRILVADLLDPASFAVIAQCVASWEPQLELMTGVDESRVYEPDGTLYVISLSDQTTLTLRHKTCVLRRGDAFVLPAAVSVEVEPPFHFLAIRHAGTPPNHFRERFIQTWGIDPRLVAQIDDAERQDPIDLLPDQPLRYRCTYRLFNGELVGVQGRTNWGIHLVVAMDGTFSLASQAKFPIELEPNHLVIILPETVYGLTGKGRLGLLTFETEIAYEANRLYALAGQDRRVDPEFRPTIPPGSDN